MSETIRLMLGLVGCWTLCAFIPQGQDRVIPIGDVGKDIVEKGTCGGKYSELIHVLKVPEDKATYGEFKDWGHWGGGSWAGVDNNPAGYWVYVEPYWLVFKNEQKKDEKSDAGQVIPVGDIGKDIVEKGSVGGKYTELIHVLKVPRDKATYGEFKDWGHWGGGSWAGVDNNPAGYWVYVDPYWLVFKNEQKKDEKADAGQVIPVGDIGKDIVEKGTCGGKYSELIHVLKAPGDKATYGEFKDWGHWGGGSWAGVDNNPAGYWVYVEPYWLVFKNQK